MYTQISLSFCLALGPTCIKTLPPLLASLKAMKTDKDAIYWFSIIQITFSFRSWCSSVISTTLLPSARRFSGGKKFVAASPSFPHTRSYINIILSPLYSGISQSLYTSFLSLPLSTHLPIAVICRKSAFPTGFETCLSCH